MESINRRSSSSSKKPVLVITSIAALSIFWLLTGGFVSINHYWYGGNDKLAVRGGIPLSIWIDTNIEAIGLPFVMLYESDRLPYSLQISAYDHDLPEYASLSIEELSIEYPEGTVIDLITPADNWRAPFQTYEYYNSSLSGVVKNEALRLAERFEGCIKERGNINLRLKGEYLLKDGSRIPIRGETTMRGSRRTDGMTFWNYVAGC